MNSKASAIALITITVFGNVTSLDLGSNQATHSVKKAKNYLSDNGTDTGSVIPYIVGGEQAGRNEFPFLVNLRTSAGSSAFCGGALIAKDVVLTAAHCISDLSPDHIYVVAGDHNLFLPEDTEQASGALRIKSHEYYNEDRIIHDIALIKLKKNFTENDFVKVIPLPDSEFDILESTNGTVAGWGSLAYNGPPTVTLMKVTVPLVNTTQCNSAYNGMVTRNQFCAGEEAGGKDSCQGDSGGPFICNGAPGVICGIVSYGYECARPNYPGVYTKVSSYVDWINQNWDVSATSSVSIPSILLCFTAVIHFYS